MPVFHSRLKGFKNPCTQDIQNPFRNRLEKIPIQFHGCTMSSSSTSNVIPLGVPQPNSAKAPELVMFQRRELDALIQMYSARVGTGEWRDYAIDMLKDRAVFSVFKRASDVPLYTIEKQPKLARRQGEWSVTNANGLILKRGHDLKTVLKILDRKPKLTSL